MQTGKLGKSAHILAPLILALVLLALYRFTPYPLSSLERKYQDFLLTHLRRTAPELASCVILAEGARSGETDGSRARAAAEIVGAVARESPSAIGLCDCLKDAAGAVAYAVHEAGRAVVGYRVAFGGAARSPRGLREVEKSRIRFSTNPWGRGRQWVPQPQAALECADARAADAAAGCGFTAVSADGDGVTRAVPLVAWENDAPYEGLPVALVAVARGAGRVILQMRGEAVEGISFGGFSLATDPRGRLLIREYAGGIPAYSASDLLGGKLPRRALAGKVVLIGSEDRLCRTRDSSSVPEACVYATAVDNALRGTYLRRARALGFAECALMVLFPFLVPRLRGWRRACAALGGMAAVLAALAVLLRLFGQESRPLLPALSALISWGLPRPPGRP